MLAYSTLHYVTLHSITLHSITFHYISLHVITFHYMSLHIITRHYMSLHVVSYVHRYSNMLTAELAAVEIVLPGSPIVSYPVFTSIKCSISMILNRTVYMTAIW